MEIKGYLEFIFILGLMVFICDVRSIINVDTDFACAEGISTIPPLDKLGLPKDRFPPQIPNAVGICNVSCGQSSVCRYNWADSLAAFPFLLFKCNCPASCPPEKILYAGYLNINCENVTQSKSRCICPFGKSAFKCTLAILPVQTINAYYCVCCNGKK